MRSPADSAPAGPGSISELRVPVEELRAVAERILVAAGALIEDADVVADCLLDADRREVHSHGLVRLASYVEQIEAGEIEPAARPVLSDGDAPTAWVDAGRCLGAVSSTLAMDAAIERARRFGIGAVSVRQGTHFGPAAYYTQRAARRGFVGMTVTSTPAVMAPWGGADPVLGNNPLSVAAPAGPGRPLFVLDMAQTAVARGRIKLAEDAGEAIPEGWALAPDGQPTTDPSAALDGALLPFGGYKASALAMALEILAAAVSGSALSFELANTGLTGRVSPGATDGARVAGVGALHLAIDPARLGAGAHFPERVGALADAVSGARRAPGFPTVPTVPGAVEAERAERADREGAVVHPSTRAALQAVSQRLGLDLPAALRSDQVLEENTP